MKVDAEIEYVSLQATPAVIKDRERRPPEAGEGKEGFSVELLEGFRPCR